jgi:hypothetical protein
MRLWSIHPRYLDRQGLLALWREGLLARAVLLGRTRGYFHHPQLARFREVARPVAALNAYLHEVAREAARRGYRFDTAKLGPAGAQQRIRVADAQLSYEWRHLNKKLFTRDRSRWRALRTLATPQPHPLFRLVPGPIADWERLALPARRRAR